MELRVVTARNRHLDYRPTELSICKLCKLLILVAIATESVAKS